MKQLFQQNLTNLPTSLVFSLLIAATFVPQSIEAQLRLPKLFNRDEPDHPGRPGPIDRIPKELLSSDDRPIPYSIHINALKGYESSFTLSSKTYPPGKMVEFVIRDFPTAGKLVGLLTNPKNRSTATITYYADPDSAATIDSFTYVARYPGGKFSAEAKCQIQIKDAQAAIQAGAPVVDFGNVLIGESIVKEVFITNTGNAPYFSKLDLISPWKVLNPPNGQLAIPAESRTSIKVAFTPTIGGPVSYELPFGTGEKGTCKLTAVGIQPFSFKQDSWEPKVNPKTRQREVTVLITNNSSKPSEVFLRASSRIRIEGGSTIILPPEKEYAVILTIPANDVLPIDGGLEIKMREGFRAITKIKSGTVPGELKVEIPNQLVQDMINFGRVESGSSLEKNIVLTNLGGELLAIDGAIEEPFRILTRVDRQLSPKESLTVTIGYYPGETDKGGFDQYAVFAARDQQIKLRLLGNAIKADPKPTKEIVGRTPTTAPPETPTTTAVPTVNSTTPTEFVEPPKKARTIVDNVYSPEDLHLISTKSKLVEISWTAPRDADTSTFDVEIRSPQTANRSWAPHSSVQLKQIDRLVKAKIEDLDPNTDYEFRVFTVDSRGRSSTASTVITSKTTKNQNWLYIGLLVLLLGVAALAGVYFKFIRNPLPKELKSAYL